MVADLKIRMIFFCLIVLGLFTFIAAVRVRVVIVQFLSLCVVLICVWHTCVQCCLHCFVFVLFYLCVKFFRPFLRWEQQMIFLFKHMPQLMLASFYVRLIFPSNIESRFRWDFLTTDIFITILLLYILTIWLYIYNDNKIIYNGW